MHSKKIYFVCPSNNFASGGVKQIYRMAEILNRNGYNAVILTKKRSKSHWFDHHAPTEYSPYLFKKIKFSYKKKEPGFFERLLLELLKIRSTKLAEKSFIVVPEIYGPDIHKIFPGQDLVIFNQNCYYTFDHFLTETDLTQTVYGSSNLKSVICVSEDSRHYLKNAFPELNIHRLHLGIDQKVFKFSASKKKQIAFMPRKLSEDVRQVILLLRQRNLPDWTLKPIENKSEIEVAQIMQDSAIYLSFNHKEGFGLPPAEAMLCGCMVIGYQGQAGKEYFNQDYSAPVADGNIVEFVNKIQDAISLYENDKSQFVKKCQNAAAFIEEHYSMQQEEEDIKKIWDSLFAAPNRC